MPLYDLTGGASTGAHPYGADDILSNEGGVLRKRGRTLLATDFSDGFSGMEPVFNLSGDKPWPSLSIVSLPGIGTALRIATPATGPTLDAQAIFRSTRPRKNSIVSISAKIATATEYTHATLASANAPALAEFGIERDTQAMDNSERSYFKSLYRKTWIGGGGTHEGNPGGKWFVRGGGAAGVPYVGAGLNDTIAGENEGKPNFTYHRTTTESGSNARYHEIQAGGLAQAIPTHTSGGVAINATHALQYDPADPWSDFRGGDNYMFTATKREGMPEGTVGVLYVTNLLVTYGDELA